MPNPAPAWPREYIERARPTDVAEMQAAMRLASRDNIDYCDALARIRTPYGSHPVGPTSPTTGPGGCQLSEGERYAFNEMMDGRYPSDDMEYA